MAFFQQPRPEPIPMKHRPRGRVRTKRRMRAARAKQGMLSENRCVVAWSWRRVVQTTQPFFMRMGAAKAWRLICSKEVLCGGWQRSYGGNIQAYTYDPVIPPPRTHCLSPSALGPGSPGSGSESSRADEDHRFGRPVPGRRPRLARRPPGHGGHDSR